MDERAIAATCRSAYAALQRGDAEGAARILAPLLAAAPGRADLLHLHGMILRGRGDLDASRQVLERAVEASGGSAEIRNTLGNLLVEMNRLDEAEIQFAAANASQPSYASAWINRGRLATRRGDYAKAIRLLKRACETDSRSVLAHTSLGEAYRGAGDHEKSEKVFRRAISLDPAKAAPRLGLGLALRSLDRISEAIREYDAAERAGIRSPQLLESRAGAWAEVDEPERARQELERLTAQYPGYLDGHRARARLFLEWGLEGDPFESFGRTAEAFPTEASIWNAWIATLLAFRQYQAAVEVTLKAEAALGPSPATAAARATAQSELGEIEEATRLFEASAPALSGQPPFLNAFARHLLKAGEPVRAARIAEDALRLDRFNQVSWAYLGTAWRLTGDAREHWLHDYGAHVAAVEAVPPGWQGSAADFASHAAPVLRRLHLSRAHPPDQTLRHGTQTPGALFDRRDLAIRQIRDAVVAATQGFVDTLPDDDHHPLLSRKAQELDFSGSWSVRLTRHGFHVNHVHERGWISSAYYFALPPSDPSDHANAGWLQLGAPPDELGLGLGPRRLVEPAVGTLVLFPSSMWHGTIPFASGGERLTAAFDIVPATAAP